MSSERLLGSSSNLAPAAANHVSGAYSPHTQANDGPRQGATSRSFIAAESWKSKYLVKPNMPGSSLSGALPSTLEDDGGEAGATPTMALLGSGGGGSTGQGNDLFEVMSLTDYPHYYTPQAGAERYVYMAAWLALLAANYAATRATAVWVGLPQDGSHDLDPIDLLDDFTKLMTFGFVLGWFSRAAEYGRLAWLLSRRQALYFLPVFFFTPLVYSVISDLPGLQHSLEDISDWGAAQWFAVSCGGLAVLIAGIYHVRLAARWKEKAEFRAYLASRLLVFAFFGCAAALVAYDDKYRVHLHHLYLGWAFALFAEFNTPASAVTLAVTAGIFIQGIGAYSFANNLYNPNCFRVTSPEGLPLLCEFNSSAPVFQLRMCPTEPALHVDAACMLG